MLFAVMVYRCHSGKILGWSILCRHSLRKTSSLLQFAADLHLDGPPPALNFAIFAVLLLAAFWSRVRERGGSAPG
jgi:hypothetical protein